MTAQISESNPAQIDPSPITGNQVLENKIRIEQSVQAQTNMPVNSYGSFGVILLMFYIYWDLALQSGDIYSLVVRATPHARLFSTSRPALARQK
jgi:hypothetical protein